jgi:sarcosine oxidase, subunit beta
MILTERSVYASVKPVPMAQGPPAHTADVVVVGGGTVGGWCAYFLKQAGLDHVVVLESDRLGQGASSRAAGIVRSQGGTRWAVDLGEWSRKFYLSQRETLGIDSGFTPQGYLLPCFTDADIAAARARLAMQQEAGLGARWVDSDEVDALNPSMAAGKTLGGTYFADDGYINPPRNVLAYTVALAQTGVDVREGVRFTGVRTHGDRVTHVETSNGTIATDRVVLTGGPKLAAIGDLAGIKIPVGGVRHQIAVTEPHDAFEPSRQPMVFDVVAGLYWRPEERGLLFGMSNPDEAPGKAREIDEPYLAKMRRRLAELVPATDGLGLRRCWAATIDFTPDHLPILGPAHTEAGVIADITVAAPGGHGMMWGPGVARAAADLALTGTTSVTDVTDLGLDRFDAEGRSKLPADPIALPFPESSTHA